MDVGLLGGDGAEESGFAGEVDGKFTAFRLVGLSPEEMISALSGGNPGLPRMNHKAARRQSAAVMATRHSIRLLDTDTRRTGSSRSQTSCPESVGMPPKRIYWFYGEYTRTAEKYFR